MCPPAASTPPSAPDPAAPWRAVGAPADEERTWRGPVGVHLGDLSALDRAEWAPQEVLDLRILWEQAASLPGFGELIVPALLPGPPDAAHAEAVRRLLDDLGGRGLVVPPFDGDAEGVLGLLCAELGVRGLADQVLVVCAPGLAEHVAAEVRRRAGVELAVATTGGSAALAAPKVVLDHDLAEAEAEADGLSARQWDLVVVLDAHQVAGDDAGHVRRALAQVLADARHAALVTATPAREDLIELHRLLELLSPGALPAEGELRSRLIDPDEPHVASRPDELRALLEPVLVRVAPGVGERPLVHVDHHEVDLDEAEQAVADEVRALVEQPPSSGADWVATQRLLYAAGMPGPGLAAVATDLADQAEGERVAALGAVASQAGALTGTTRARLVAVLSRLWLAEHGRVVVAVAQPADATHLARHLAGEGVAVTALPDGDGSTVADEHLDALARWRGDDGGVLVVTDEVGGGLDLTAASCLVSADLPWDPLQLQARIDWLSPDGDRHLATFVATGTPDVAVLEVLRDQLHLFDAAALPVRALVAELDPETAPEGSDEDPVAFAARLVAAVADAGVLGADPFEDLRADLDAARRRTRALEDAAGRVEAWAPRPTTAGRSLLEPARRAAALRELVLRWSTALGTPAEVVDGLVKLDGTRPLAFEPIGLRARPGAEMVTPGSPAFGRLMDGVRTEVPITVDVAEAVELAPVAATDHRSEVELVDRRVEPPTTWSATATWRVRLGAGREEVHTVHSGTPPQGLAERRSLAPGEPLPRAFPAAAAMAEAVLEAGVTDLGPVGAQVEAEARERAEARRSRLAERHRVLVDAARAAIEESVVGTPEHDRATDRLRSLHDEGPPPPGGPLDGVTACGRASLVALHLHGGDDVQVVERWRHRDGAEAETRYPWDPGGGADRRSAVSGEAIEVVALCAGGHLLDETDLVWCPCCERHGCDACGPDRELAACPACGVEVCAECRFDEHGRLVACRDCREPQRTPEEDDERAVAWALGGGARLRVGARHAVLLRPDEEPIELVPDVDLDDPVRRRLRAAADAVGLPLDLGAAARAADPTPTKGQTDAHFEVVAGATWKVEEGRGATIEVDLDDFDGPDGPEPLVVAESAVGLQRVLERVRDEEEPPAPPAFVRTPHHDVDRTEVVGDGLRRTVTRAAVDGTVEDLAEEVAPLVAQEDGAALAPHLFRPVALATLGSVRLELARLHRSTVVRVTTAKGTDEWFVGAGAGATFGGELAWASWAEDEGLPPGAVLSVAPRPDDLTDDDLAAPVGTELVDRHVVGVWGAEANDEDGPETALHPANDGDLVLVGYDEVPDLVMARPPRTLAALATALSARGQELDPLTPAPHRLEHRWLEVEETWRGHGEVHLAYKVRPGEPAWPQLDDTRARAHDFEVDDHGHLHEPGAGWRCLACLEHHCRACGPVGAMEPCGTCDQPACGLCRARAARPVPEERCQRCGSHSCGDCGRVPGTTTCVVCRREVCARCRPSLAAGAQGGGDRCEACAAIRPALAEEVDGLPSVLGAGGLHTWLGAADGESVAVLLGRERREAAVLRGGDVDWWVHVDGQADDLRRVRLAAARRWAPDGDLDVVSRGAQVDLAADRPGFLLVAEETPDVRWQAELDTGLVTGTTLAPADPSGASTEATALGEDVADVLVVEVGGRAERDAPRPTPAPAALDGGQTWSSLAEGRRLESAGRLLVEDRRQATATWITADGLQRVVAGGEGSKRTTAPWQVGVSFSWMVDGWVPKPDVVAYALLADFEAALVRVGRHLALGVRGADQVVWWTLREEQGDLQRTLLGEHLTGEEQLLDLRVVTDPGKLEPPTIVEATFVERRMEPVLEEVGSTDGDPDEALRAAAAWVRREAALPEASGPALPPDLVAGLVARADELSPPSAVTMGLALQVEETWRQGVEEFKVPYRVAPGTTVGQLRCAATGHEIRVARRDRSGHLVADVSTCRACGGQTCGACHDGTTPCATCADLVCRRCSTDDGRCPACAGLVLVDRREVKRLGLKVGRRAVVLRSTTGGVVTLGVRDEGWQLTRAAGAGGVPPVPVALPAGAATVLDTIVLAPPRASGPVPVSPPATPPGDPPDVPAPTT